MRKQIYLLFTALLACTSLQALPPAPQGPYQSIEDIRAGNLPVPQNILDQGGLPFPDMSYPVLPDSSWNWGSPSQSADLPPMPVHKGGLY